MGTVLRRRRRWRRPAAVTEADDEDDAPPAGVEIVVAAAESWSPAPSTPDAPADSTAAALAAAAATAAAARPRRRRRRSSRRRRRLSAPAWGCGCRCARRQARGHRAWDLPLSPKGVKVGAYFKCGDEVLAEIDGFSPSRPSLHRIQLPPPDTPLGGSSRPAARATPDTGRPHPAARSSRGSPRRAPPRWARSSRPPTARTRPRRAHACRRARPHRLRAVATCKRLDLPLPPSTPRALRSGSGPRSRPTRPSRLASRPSGAMRTASGLGCPPRPRRPGIADGSRVEVRLS